MYCGHCGAQLEEGAAFCTHCGTKVRAEVDETVVETAKEPSFDSPIEAETQHPSKSTPADTSESMPSVSVPEVDETVTLAPDETVVLDATGTDASEAVETVVIASNLSPAPDQQPPQERVEFAYQIGQTKQMPVQPAVAYATENAPAAKSKKRTGIIIAVVCIIIAALAAAGIFAYTHIKTHQRTHEPVQVQFGFTYVGDQAAQPIGVPLVIQGTDLDGKAVDQQLLATPGDNTAELLAGSYTVTLAGNPVTAEGIVYAPQDGNSRQLEIPVPAVDMQAPATPSSIDFSFEVVAPDKVSDQQVEEIKAWMTSFGVNTDDIQRICATIVDKRNAEAARVALEQEKQAALAANPSTVLGPGPRTHAPGDTARLTGTVRVGYFDSGVGPSGKGDVCYLELPGTLTVTGTQYGNTSSNKIILGDGFSSYQDKVVTISATYSVQSTASIKEAACSPIWANNPQVVRVFE